MDLKIIATPPLGEVAQGVAGLFGGGLEARGFSPNGAQLLVKASYSDTNYPTMGLRTAFWTYDVGLGQYDACVNTLISSSALEVTDVVMSTFNGQSQLIANYRGTGADALTLNKLALIRNGVLVTDDLVAQICKNQSDAAVDAIRVSADGRFVAVETAASNLTDAVYANDGLANIYLLDLVLGTSFRITTVNGAESASNSLLGDMRVGADGALSVAFESAQAFTSASIDSNGASDAFVWRLLPANFSSPDLGTISLSSIALASAAGASNPKLNANGVLFDSDSAAFSSKDLNNANDVWQSTGTSVGLVSPVGSDTLSGASSLAATSDNGKFVAVLTASPEIAGDTGVDQLAIVNTVSNTTVIVSKSASGVLADNSVLSPKLSADGTRVAFSSDASNLGAGQASEGMQLYLADLNHTGAVTLGGTASQGQTLTATVSDADGASGSIAYQWTVGGVVASAVTTASYLLTQAEVGKPVSVAVSYKDDNGRAEVASSAASTAVLNVNDAPTGSVTIQGSATQGQTLTATNSLADLDGLGTVSYQWRSGGTAITGATTSTYVLTQEDVGKAITVAASYTDGHGALESVTSGAVAVSAGKTVDLLAYSWKAHTLLSDVSLSATGTNHSGSTDASGAASFTAVTDASLTLTASRAVPSGEAATTSSAVNLQDAIAILKMIVGLEVNGTGKALSPYQALAADYDGNGSVQLSDAIGVLKHVVGLTAPDPTWYFVNEIDSTVPGKANLTPGVAQSSIAATLSGNSPVHVGLVGYLSGDVDGSFAGASGASALSTSYFSTLVSAHSDLSLAQFGVYTTP